MFYVNTCLLLSFNVFEFVMLLSSMDLKLKCRCTDCSFCTSVLMDMFADYYPRHCRGVARV